MQSGTKQQHSKNYEKENNKRKKKKKQQQQQQHSHDIEPFCYSGFSLGCYEVNM